MINLSKGLVFLKSGDDLNSAFDTALSKTCKYLGSVSGNKPFAKNSRVYTEVMYGIHSHDFDVVTLLNDWLEICMAGLRGKSSLLSVSRIVPGALCEHSHVSYESFVLFTKLYLIVLHKEKALLLPYDFSRPTAHWFYKIEAKFDIWSDTIKPFRKLELARREVLAADPDDIGRIVSDPELQANATLAETRRGRRLIQCSSKLLLATDWYTISDIDVYEVEALRGHLLSKNFFITTPLPLLQIMEYLKDCNKDQVSDPLAAWIKRQGEELVLGFEASLQKHIKKVLKSELEPLHKAQMIFQEAYVPLTDFSHDKIGQWDVVAGVYEAYGIDVEASYVVWLECQEYFFDSKHLESTKSYRSQFGRLNVWLFVYLPSWMDRNKEANFIYPDIPSKFTGRFHFDCSHSTNGRPLSLVEFSKAMGWAYNYSAAICYRNFFTVLIGAHDLPGCADLKQPVHKRPVSKKYDAVTKNIFPGPVLLFYVEYLYAIERVSNYLFENSDRLYEAFIKSEEECQYFSFEEFGFVPFFYWNGECYMIKEVSRFLLSFTVICGRHYYNPGLVRFVLLLLEVGPRGQAGQWLDVSTYDRLADRMSNHPLHLTTLYINTDKVHSTPLFVITVNRAIWLLDSQREWRVNMIENFGAHAFKNKVDYESRPHSKWGAILPLFAFSGSTGQPFSDSAYGKFWTHCCFSFQNFLRVNDISEVQLVAYIPVSNVGRHINWEAWVSGKIKPSTLKVVNPESENGTVYAGVHSPLSFRSMVTPHGARASFVTEMSTLLSPEEVAELTGQSAGQVVKYIKSDTLHRNLQGAYNWRDARAQLNRAANQHPRMSDVASDLDKLRGRPNFIENASQKGWVTSATGPFKKALELIANDKEQSFGISDTHICVLKFECNADVIEEVGYRNCAYCPLAIYSINNIVAVAAQRTLSYDNYRSLSEEIVRRPSDWSDAERINDSRLLQVSAKEAIGWHIVETNLWTMIRASKEKNGHALLIGDQNSVVSNIQRYEVDRDSAEDFFDRLASATVYPNLVSEDFKFKIDRAARLLMAGDGQVEEALLAPFGFSSAEVLAAKFRGAVDRKEFDLAHYVKLVTMSHREWATQLEKSSPPSSIIPIIPRGDGK